MQSFSLDVAQLTKQMSDLQQQCLGLLGAVGIKPATRTVFKKSLQEWDRTGGFHGFFPSFTMLSDVLGGEWRYL